MNDSEWRQFLTQQGAHWDARGLSHFGDRGFPSLSPDTAMVADLSHWAALRFRGGDSRKFLQGQVTCDMAAVDQNHWQRGACCDVKGRALFSFYCAQLPVNEGEVFMFILPRSTVELAQNQLKKYAVFSKTEIEPVTDWQLFGLLATEQAAEKLLDANLTGTHGVSHQKSRGVIALPGNRYLLLVKNDGVQTLWQQLAEHCQLVGYPAWDLAAIRAGYGDVEDATSGEFIPQLLNFHLTGGISFTKGCYLGQEVVARMNYRGTLKRHMRRAQIETSELPALNAPVFGAEGEQSVGNIVSAVRIDPDSIEALAVVTDKAFDDDNVYFDREKQHKLRFLSLPYAITK